MKLSDLAPTPAAAAHTAKLSHQVHKATVAAAKAPRLELGVLGISIGQKQSTGDTSRPAAKWQNKPFMEGQLNESSGEIMLQLMSMMQARHTEQFSQLTPQQRDQLVETAVTMVKDPELSAAMNQLNIILNNINLEGSSPAIRKLSAIKLPDARIATAVEALSKIDLSEDFREHFSMLISMKQRLSAYQEWISGEENWFENRTSLEKTAIKIAAKKLGLVP